MSIISPLIKTLDGVSTLKKVGSVASSTMSRVGRSLRGMDQAPFFHGTPAPWANHALGPITAGRGPNNLYGAGLYMTGHRGIAKEYAENAIGEVTHGGTIYGLRWKHKPNLIDLDKPLPGKVIKEFEAYRPADQFGPDLSKMPGTEAYDYFKDWAEQAADPRASTIFHPQVMTHLKLYEMGYHGFKHQGGQVLGGSIKHPVNIAFNPQKDIEIMGYQTMADASDTVQRNAHARANITANIALQKQARLARQMARSRKPSSGRMGGVPSHSRSATMAHNRSF